MRADGAERKSDDARMSATTPDAPVPMIELRWPRPKVFQPSATAPRNAQRGNDRFR